MNKKKRKQLYVDPSVQGVLLLRTVLYWSFCIVMVTMFMVCWRIVTGPSRDLYVHLDYLWFHYAPVFVSTLLLLPILIIDTLTVSNRFAGPMVRLRKAMRQLADGDTNVSPLEFRKKDFWKDFADDFNRLLARMESEQNADPPVAEVTEGYNGTDEENDFFKVNSTELEEPTEEELTVAGVS